MTYEELLPRLLQKNLVLTIIQPAIPKDIPYGYKANAHCTFHQGAPGHNIENCFPLKIEVQKLVRSVLLSFRDVGSNVQANPLPNHGEHVVNMVDGCPGKYRIFYAYLLRGDLV